MKKEEIKKYAGKKMYALCSRMGGRYRDIYCLTVYVITHKGTMRYVEEVMGCVANKEQCRRMESLTGGKYAKGRPCAAKFKRKEELESILF